MGRKPNAVVLAYFDRGERCDDTSNRYKYTCRVCAEHFEKGRLETLIAHITGICPGLTPAQRDQIFQLNSDPNGHRLLIEAHVAHERALSSGLTGLEALAEASRQVGGPGSSFATVNTTQQNYDPALDNELAISLGFQSDPQTPAQRLSNLAGLASFLGFPLLDSTSGSPITPDGRLSPHLSASSLVTSLSRNGNGVPGSLKISSLRDGGIGPLRSSPGNTSVSPRSQRIRGRFSDERREQVKHIRSKGACIRCRMLRKTCSAGDPCRTCCNIETARIWKTPCMRTKLSKVFELYSAEPFGIIASIRMQHAAAHYTPIDDRLPLIFQFGGDPVNSIKFDCQVTLLNASEESVSSLPPPQYSLPEDASWQDIGDELDGLLLRSTARIHDYELYEVIKSTLRFAEKMRHNEEDVIVAQSLHLWDLTHLLTSPQKSWRISKPRLPSSNGVTASNGSTTTASNEQLGEDSTSLLHCQLLALASQQASRAFTALVNSLESSLIRRTTYRFSHFIAVVLLLACVERMEAWMSSFPDPDSADAQNPDRPQWPLSEPPSYYRSEAECFVDLVSTLLKVRSVPPKVLINAAGILQPKPHKVSQALEETTVRWFERLQITLPFLNERKDAHYDPNDFRSLETMYVSRFLLVCLEEQ